MTELPGIGNLELHRPRSLRPPAANFGKSEFEAVAAIDRHAVLRFRHGIENRLASDSIWPAMTMRGAMSIAKAISAKIGS
jgi:hypothetical protein